jgi:predicted unusual protein kinase regulating ubiquinone biosynthesis (AarF/ABC1/UbiB family)
VAARRAPPSRPGAQAAADAQAQREALALLRTQGLRLLRSAGGLAMQAVRLPESATHMAAALLPLTRLLAREAHIGVDELAPEIDRIFAVLYQHPLTEQSRRFTSYLRARNMLPNEGSTENLIRYVVNEAVARSPIPVPQKIVDEFWDFFHELMSEPELRGLGDLGLDIARLLLRTYEPLLVEVINELKDIFYTNQQRTDALLRRVQVVRRDLQIIRRQIRALRYIRPFFQTDAKDFAAQAQIVAKMVREFGPFFIKMAQVAAATADFLPEQIARELMVFQEDVPPMSAEEARQAVLDSFGKAPEDIYFGFDAEHPLKSGSIGSVYLAKKPVREGGVERLMPVVIKIGRHNLDREFLMGKASIGLMLLSSQYWAPHGKFTPFLKAMTAQIDGFIEGFRGELQFEREAAIQARFAQRAMHSSVWRVPRVYAATERIIEMEYVAGAVNIVRAAQHFKPRDPDTYRRRLAAKLLFTLLSQVFIHQEVHGDLHPGNVMVGADGRLHLIDWGNTVQLAGKVAPVLRYLKGALAADADAVTDALIAICTEPGAALLRRAEIRDALARTLQKKRLRPLGRWFAWTLALEGPEGWMQRAHMLGQLMSNTQHLGLVVRSEYLHLSRSVSAVIGTLASLYQGVPRHRVAADVLWALNSFPARALQDTLRGKPAGLRDGLVALARRAVFAEAKAVDA